VTAASDWFLQWSYYNWIVTKLSPLNNFIAFILVVVLQETLMVMAACMRQGPTTRHSKCLQHCVPPDIGLATRGFYRTVAHLTSCLFTQSLFTLFSTFSWRGPPLYLIWSLTLTKPQFSFGIYEVMHSFVVCHCSCLNSLMPTLFSVTHWCYLPRNYAITVHRSWWMTLQHLLGCIGLLLSASDSSNHVEWWTLVIEFILLNTAKFDLSWCWA